MPTSDDWTVDADFSGLTDAQMARLMEKMKTKLDAKLDESKGRNIFNMMNDGGKGTGIKPYPKKMRRPSGGASVTGGASACTRGSRERESKRKSPKNGEDSEGSNTTFYTAANTAAAAAAAAADDVSVAKTVVSVPVSVRSKSKSTAPQYLPDTPDSDL